MGAGRSNTFAGRFSTFDIDYKVQLELLAKEIDMASKKARSSVYQGEGTDAASWYSTYLSPFLGVCLKVTDQGATLYQGTYEGKFKANVQAVVEEITTGLFALDGQWTHGLLDSILVKIDLNGTESTGNRNEYNTTKLMPIYAS